VNHAAEECATALARAIPAEQCVAILNPFIETHEFPFNLAAIKMQIKVIEAAEEDRDIVSSLLPMLIPRLLKVCQSLHGRGHHRSCGGLYPPTLQRCGGQGGSEYIV